HRARGRRQDRRAGGSACRREGRHLRAVPDRFGGEPQGNRRAAGRCAAGGCVATCRGEGRSAARGDTERQRAGRRRRNAPRRRPRRQGGRRERHDLPRRRAEPAVAADDDGIPPRGAGPSRAEAGRARRVRLRAGRGRLPDHAHRTRRGRERSGTVIARLIRWSIANRFLVLLATVMVAAWGVWSMVHTPVDALPDLSDVQVIIRTSYPGQAPQIVENQVTYPLATTMLSVPGAKTVRGISFFGDSFVYVLFEDGTDLYWARSRVLEYLNQAQSRLPATAKAALGPDATGVGWIFEYALVDRTHRHDLSQLRALQDWFLKYELKTLPNVAEVASLGGMVKQYQVVLDPAKLAAYNIPPAKVIEAIQHANSEAGGSVLEIAETEYMVRASGYLQSLDDFRTIPLGVNSSGIPVRVGDVATVQLGPEMRRGVTELNGQGEVAGGVIVMRSGKNAQATIRAVRARLAELERSLPAGVEIVPTYDRS